MPTDFPTICPRCGAPVGSLKFCLAFFAGINAKEYSDPKYAAASHLTEDAHALQHPEDHNHKDNTFHLVRLCWILEHGGSSGTGSGPSWLEAAFKGNPELPQLDPPPPLRRGHLTVASILPAIPPDEHIRLIRLWAESVWGAWSRHHAWARTWINDHKPA